MTTTLNEKFGITMDYQIDKGIMYKVHIWSANYEEIDAYIIDEEEIWQDNLKEEIKKIKSLQTIEELEEFIHKWLQLEITDKENIDLGTVFLDFKCVSFYVY